MDSKEIRQKFLEFFQKNGHEVAPSSSLIPDDPSVLLTTAGMQQFKKYYSGTPYPFKNSDSIGVTSVQKCFRTSDIDEVGDESHLTFFEMLGNFSFGGYFKEQAIKLAYEFITQELGLKIDYVSVFAGEPGSIPEDRVSEKIWQSIDPNIIIKKFGKEDNFWGPTGDEGPCGPTTEIYVKGVEVWNIVFNQYYKKVDGSLSELKIQGIDTGMGLERLAMMVQDKKNVFETDLFAPIINSIIPIIGDKPISKLRIIADHLRSAVFLVGDGVEPSNNKSGYILRRLIRRALFNHFRYVSSFLDTKFYLNTCNEVIRVYGSEGQYKKLIEHKDNILNVIGKETEKFASTLEKGLREFEKMKPEKFPITSRSFATGYGFDMNELFNLYFTYGFPIEMSIEEIKKIYKEYNEKNGVAIVEFLKDDEDRILQEFQKALKKHQELSRTASAGMFKGGLADASEATIKYHTAAHLMLEALRRVLGDHVSQKGSNITPERLRFDFSHAQKMTPEEIKKVEDIVNEKINEDLQVRVQEMTLEEAKAMGATGVFDSKYGERVTVYTIGDSSVNSEPPFSREICGGPHVNHTGEIGHFKIAKEESSSSGIRRIKAVVD